MGASEVPWLCPRPLTLKGWVIANQAKRNGRRWPSQARHKKLNVALYTGNEIAMLFRFQSSKHCSLIHILGRFERHLQMKN